MEPVNQEENRIDVVPDAAIATRPSLVMEMTLLPPPPSRTEDVPHAPPQETKELLTNLVNMLRQQNNILERVERNDEKILTEIAMQIEVSQ